MSLREKGRKKRKVVKKKASLIIRRKLLWSSTQNAGQDSQKGEILQEKHLGGGTPAKNRDRFPGRLKERISLCLALNSSYCLREKITEKLKKSEILRDRGGFSRCYNKTRLKRRGIETSESGSAPFKKMGMVD